MYKEITAASEANNKILIIYERVLYMYITIALGRKKRENEREREGVTEKERDGILYVSYLG